jgi:hypothetical protein
VGRPGQPWDEEDLERSCMFKARSGIVCQSADIAGWSYTSTFRTFGVGVEP